MCTYHPAAKFTISPSFDLPMPSRTNIVWLVVIVVVTAGLSGFGLPPAVAQPGRPMDRNSSVAAEEPPRPFSSRVSVRMPTEEIPVGQPLEALELADLEAMALANHPGLRAAGARVEAARGRWIQGGLPPNPTIGYQGSEIGDGGRAGQQGLRVGQKVITGGKLGLNRAVASQDVARLSREFAAQRWRVLNDVRLAFYEVLAAQRSLEITRELVKIGSESVGAVDSLVRAQEASEVDLLQARIESESAAIALNNAENHFRAAWQKLAAVVAVPELLPRPLAGSLDDGADALSYDEAIARLASNSPELAAAWAKVNRARWALRRARAEPVPDVNLQGGVQYDDGSGDTIASMQVYFPLPLVNRNQGGIREAAANVASAEAEARQLELALQQDLAEVFERYANARQQVRRFREVMLPSAQASLDKVLLGYRQGEFPYLVLLTTQRTFFNTNLAYVDALRALRTSAVEIEGLLLRGSLEAGRPGAVDSPLHPEAAVYPLSR